MQHYILIVLGSFVLSATAGFVFIPLILNFCKSRRLYDLPNRRKVHHNPVPRLGGVAFLPSMLIAFIISMAVMSAQGEGGIISINLWSMGFLLSLLLIYVTGIIDDIIGLGAKVKFVVQIVAASVLPACGLYINNLYGLFGIYAVPFWAGTVITVGVVVLIVNSMNLIDGIDGLCASLSIIALGGFFYCFWREEIAVYCILISALIGVLIPYLYFNIFGKSERNRKIFMGDAGSLTLGYILGFLFVKFSMDNPTVMNFSAYRIALAYSLLIVPVFDVFRVIIHRLRLHKPLFTADKNHIHHKLIRAGLSQHEALLSIIVLEVFFVVFNYLSFKPLGITSMVIADVALYTVFQMLLTLYIERREKNGADVAGRG